MVGHGFWQAIYSTSKGVLEGKWRSLMICSQRHWIYAFGERGQM